MAIKKKLAKKPVIKRPAKRPVVKKKAKKPAKKEILAGSIVHYFDHITVAVIKLTAPLAVGDEIRVSGGVDTDFKQKVQSMQIEHQAIKKAKKGQEVGIKTKEKVRDGYKVYKV